MGFRLAYLHLIMTHFKGQGLSQTYFTSEYLDNGDREKKHYYCSQIGSHGFRLSYLDLTLTHSKDQGQGHAYSECKYLENCK